VTALYEIDVVALSPGWMLVEQMTGLSSKNITSCIMADPLSAGARRRSQVCYEPEVDNLCSLYNAW
jgi:hypothetical protein